jgi:fructosamine-3-kinase
VHSNAKWESCWRADVFELAIYFGHSETGPAMKELFCDFFGAYSIDSGYFVRKTLYTRH